ncbi:MAG: transcriptional repressor [Opitutales bacterium]|nr:transcriptional repressor [Opitutales bacterium]
MKQANTFRETKQRNAIHTILDEAKRPLSPQEMLALADVHVPGIGIATIYRNIKIMVEQGVLSSVDIPGEPSRFILPQHRKTHLFLDKESGVAMMFDLDLPGIKRRLPRGMKAQDVTLFCTGTLQAPPKKKKAKG